MMNRILVPLLFLLLTSVAHSTAQDTPDPKQAELADSARQKSLTPADLKKLLLKAQSGDAEAQYWLGNVYLEGRLARKDLDEAARWLLISAEQGHVRAQRGYGMMYVSLNHVVGERWMLRAAEQGDTEAQFWLAYGYENNWFGTNDAQEALKWYKRAATGGNPDAQVELGRKYEDGEGVEQNYKLAAEWYQKAAEHEPDLGGAGQGRNDLGLLYMEGLGVPRNYVQAYFWFRLSGGDENPNAAEAKSQLTPAQIQEAEELLKEWKERHRWIPEVAAPLHSEN